MPTVQVIEELRGELARLAAVAESGGGDHGAEIVSLGFRLEELAGRVEEVAAVPVPDLAPRIDDLWARVEEVAAAIPVVETDGLAARIELLEAESRPDHGALEHLEGETSELRRRLQELSDTAARDEAVALVEARVGELEQRLAAAAPAEELRAEIERIGASTTAERQSLEQALFARVEEITATVPAADEVTELRRRVEELAARPTEDHGLHTRVGELAARLEGIASVEAAVADLTASLAGLDGRIDRSVDDGNERIEGLAAELNQRLSGLAEELGHRIGEVAERAERFVTRDEAAATAAEQATRLRKELTGLREWANARGTAVDGALEEADAARMAGDQELGDRIDEVAGAIRADAEAQAGALGARLRASAKEAATLRAQVQDLQAAAADRVAWEARLESMLEQRLDGLAARVTDEVAGARAEAEHAVGAVREQTESLGARIDELHSLRQAEAHELRTASEQLGARVETMAGLRARDAETARAATADLTARLEDLALRSAAASCEVEQALRDELGGVAARLEERDASGIEAREELRGELERAVSSVGWRLERIEESLASDDLAGLKAKVAELGRGLEEQAAIGEEQSRAAERAIRKGLASLGERLVDTESAYADAGNALRRSIQRLGAAVVEADARMADQIPLAEAEGCVAFAPTTAGYRLVELPGKPPELGSTIELEGCEGALVVTRYGRSPLPLDGRPCAYLDRA